jgi:hypothetical protein
LKYAKKNLSGIQILILNALSFIILYTMDGNLTNCILEYYKLNDNASMVESN